MVTKLKVSNKKKSFVKKGWAKFGIDGEGNSILFGIRTGVKTRKYKDVALHQYEQTFKIPTKSVSLNNVEKKNLAEKLNISIEELGGYTIKVDTTSLQYKEYASSIDEFAVALNIVCMMNGQDELYYNEETEEYETLWKNLGVKENDYFSLYNYLVEEMEIDMEGFNKAYDEILKIKEGGETDAEEEMKYLEQLMEYEEKIKENESI